MDKMDIELVRTLQSGEIFLKERPFHEAARLLGWTVEEVLERTRRLKEAGVIRRISAFLGTGSAGTSPSSRFEGFPYNVYATVHASSDEGLEKAVNELRALAAPFSCRALRTLLELKKSSPVYYPKPF